MSILHCVNYLCWAVNYCSGLAEYNLFKLYHLWFYSRVIWHLYVRNLYFLVVWLEIFFLVTLFHFFWSKFHLNNRSRKNGYLCKHNLLWVTIPGLSFSQYSSYYFRNLVSLLWGIILNLRLTDTTDTGTTQVSLNSFIVLRSINFNPKG